MYKCRRSRRRDPDVQKPQRLAWRRGEAGGYDILYSNESLCSVVLQKDAMNGLRHVQDTAVAAVHHADSAAGRKSAPPPPMSALRGQKSHAPQLAAAPPPKKNTGARGRAGQTLQPRLHRLGGGGAAEEVGGSAAARVSVVAPLPLLTAAVETPDCVVVPPSTPVEVCSLPHPPPPFTLPGCLVSASEPLPEMYSSPEAGRGCNASARPIAQLHGVSAVNSHI